MTLQELPKTAAETTLKLVRLPVELVTKVREAVEERLGSDDDVVLEPVGEPTKAVPAKPKAPKKPVAKKPAPKPAARKPKPKATAAPKMSAVDRAQSERRKLED